MRDARREAARTLAAVLASQRQTVHAGCDPVGPAARPRGARVLADWEIAEAGFFGIEDLPADTTPETRRRLKEILEDREPAEVWRAGDRGG